MSPSEKLETQMACMKWTPQRQRCGADAAYVVVTDLPGKGFRIETHEVCEAHAPRPTAMVQLIELLVPGEV